MENDMISRSALIAELEGFKLSLGDIFFRMIVDRVIERIREQPFADTMFRCKNCEHYNRKGCTEGFGWCDYFSYPMMDEHYCNFCTSKPDG